MVIAPLVAAMLAFAAPVPKSTTVQIDISEAFSTVRMKGMKKAEVADSDNKDNDLEAVRRAARRVSSSNMFLVRGETFAKALEATRTLYGDGLGTCDEPATAPETKKSSELWVGAFLGNTFTSPQAFGIDRVEIQGQTIRVAFSHPRHGGQSDDTSPYMVWVKLGRLEYGVYKLELIDSDQNDEVLMCRRVILRKD